MITTFAEGSVSVTKLHKRDGEERLVGAEHAGTGRYATQEIPMDTFPFKVTGHRTICTGRFAFARVGVSMQVNVMADQRDEAFEYVRGVVTEILEREESGLRNRERENGIIEDATVKMWGRVIEINYGLTIPFPNYESKKIEIGMTEPIGDDEPLEEAIERVQAWILERLDEEQRKFEQDSSVDVGI